jgi:hypothetical protein
MAAQVLLNPLVEALLLVEVEMGEHRQVFQTHPLLFGMVAPAQRILAVEVVVLHNSTDSQQVKHFHLCTPEEQAAQVLSF